MGGLSTFRAAVQQLRGQLGDDWDRIKHMSIIDEDGSEKCAAGHASCVACSLAVRGESRLLECRGAADGALSWLLGRHTPRLSTFASPEVTVLLMRSWNTLITFLDCARRHVRMAYLAVVASHTVNGVAAIHSDIIRDTIFQPFAELFPEKFQNKTNGVTPRRWLAFCNPPLRDLITQTLGSDAWINDLYQLQARALLMACFGVHGGAGCNAWWLSMHHCYSLSSFAIA